MSSCMFSITSDTTQADIIAMGHGTDWNTACNIAHTSFANLSLLDKGFYGKGTVFNNE